MNTLPPKRWISPQARRWLALAALLLLATAVVLLSYALLPGAEPLRLQSTLDPARFLVPGVTP